MTMDDKGLLDAAVDTPNTKNDAATTKEEKKTDLDGLFCMLGEDSRIIIRGGQVLIENMSDDLLDLALSLNPNDEGLKQRQAELNAQKNLDKGQTPTD